MFSFGISLFKNCFINGFFCINQVSAQQPSMPTRSVVSRYIWRQFVSFCCSWLTRYTATRMPWSGCHSTAQAAVMSTLTSPPPPSTGGPSGPAYGSLQDAICRQVEEPSQTTHCHGSGDDDDDVLASPEGEGMEVLKSLRTRAWPQNIRK